MEFKFVERKKGSVEIEFDEKEVAIALEGVLVDNGVDAYTYEPHPLKEGFRLHVEAKDAKAELKKAVTQLGKEWGAFKKAVESKLK